MEHATAQIMTRLVVISKNTYAPITSGCSAVLFVSDRGLVMSCAERGQFLLSTVDGFCWGTCILLFPP